MVSVYARINCWITTKILCGKNTYHFNFKIEIFLQPFILLVQTTFFNQGVVNKKNHQRILSYPDSRIYANNHENMPSNTLQPKGESNLKGS